MWELVPATMARTNLSQQIFALTVHNQIAYGEVGLPSEVGLTFLNLPLLAPDVSLLVLNIRYKDWFYPQYVACLLMMKRSLGSEVVERATGYLYPKPHSAQRSTPTRS